MRRKVACSPVRAACKKSCSQSSSIEKLFCRSCSPSPFCRHVLVPLSVSIEYSSTACIAFPLSVSLINARALNGSNYKQYSLLVRNSTRYSNFIEVETGSSGDRETGAG